MARTSGKLGSATINAVTYNGVTNWEIDYKGDAIDVTGMTDAGVKAFVGGLTEWSGSMDVVWDNTQALPTPALTLAATVAVSLVTGATGALDTWAGAVIITDCKVTVPVDGAIKLSCTFQGTGALSIS